jgi:polar amino acid transport system substrate-binding protein
MLIMTSSVGGFNMKKRFAFQIVYLLIAVMFILAFGLQEPVRAEPLQPGDSPVLKRIIARGVIRVGVNPLFKPFSFENEKKERVGIDIDIAEHLAKALDVKLEVVVPSSFLDLFSMTINNEIDVIIAAMSRIFERSKQVDFTDSYYDTGLSIMVNKIKGAQLGIGQVSSYRSLMERLKLLGKENQLIIAATTGKGAILSIPGFFPQAIVKEYPTNEKSAEAVANSEVHMMVHDEIFLKTWAQDNPEKALYKLIVFEKPYKPDTYGFAVAKGNQSLLNLLNMFIYDQLYAQGYFEKFMHKYLR